MLGLGFGISGLGVRGLGFGARGDWEREGDTEWGRCAREGRRGVGGRDAAGSNKVAQVSR